MTWIWILIIVIVAGAIIGYFSTGTKEGAAEGAATAGFGCGFLLLEIFFTLVGLWIVISLGMWLFSC